MPHYRDGTEAAVGDLVVGVPYNNGGRTIVGEVVQITPGTESCNLMVAFVADLDLEKQYGPMGATVYRAYKGGEPQPQRLLQAKTDSGETKAFVLVHRAEI